MKRMKLSGGTRCIVIEDKIRGGVEVLPQPSCTTHSDSSTSSNPLNSPNSPTSSTTIALVHAASSTTNPIQTVHSELPSTCSRLLSTPLELLTIPSALPLSSSPLLSTPSGLPSTSSQLLSTLQLSLNITSPVTLQSRSSRSVSNNSLENTNEKELSSPSNARLFPKGNKRSSPVLSVELPLKRIMQTPISFQR